MARRPRRRRSAAGQTRPRRDVHDGAPSGEPPPPARVADLVADAPFRWIREAGRGGSATVYEAEDLELLRRVAVKVYHRPDRDRVKLLHEARVAAAVAGDGIVRVFDVDPRRGWLAMEWAPRGALPPRAGMGWAQPLARALARVHRAGWVHHDVKPANVLLTAQGAPMLGDFGIARRAGEPSPPGSFGYVSPERLAGRGSDPRDDVYGFGRGPGRGARPLPPKTPSPGALRRRLARDRTATGLGTGRSSSAGSRPWKASDRT